MDHDRYPSYFLGVAVLYAIVLLAGFSYFILPASSFGFEYTDFYVLSALILLPLPLFAFYSKLSRFQVLWGKERLIRILITALTVVDFVMVLYLMILLI